MAARTGRDNQIKKINEWFESGNGDFAGTGITDSFAAFILSNSHERQMLVITETEAQAKKMAEDIESFSYGPVFFLPGREINFYEAYAHSRDIESERVRVLGHVIGGKPLIVTSSVENLLIPLRKPEDYAKSIKTVKWGGRYPLDNLTGFLVKSGYESVDQIRNKGQFSRRGGILDIFSPQNEKPYRLEFFDDEVDSIRLFDVLSQVSIEKKKEAILFPAREFTRDIESIDQAAAEIEKEMDSLDENASLDLRQKYSEILGGLKSGIVAGDVFNLSCYMPNSDLQAYFKEGSVFALIDEKRIKQRAKSYKHNFIERLKMYLEKNSVLPGQHSLVKDYDPKGLKMKCLYLDKAIASRNEMYRTMDFSVKPQMTFKGRLDSMVLELEDAKHKGYKTLIFAGGKGKATRLCSELFNRGLQAYESEGEIKVLESDSITVSKKHLSKGFVYGKGRLNVFSEMDVFGVEKKHKKNLQKSNKRAISSFTDLKPGDYVVHENHGIGRFIAIKQLEVEKMKKDYLQLAYKKGDFLYVPVSQMGLIQKYLGSNNANPKLNGLGGSEWQKTKQRAIKSIEDLTQGLLELYAKRKTESGYAFMPDSNWQREFEDMFEYDETPDQIKVIEEIKKDMARPKPMDRLLCGDVGYGKTEVALRAAFKAINDGKQVAILVPTTILAQQHYNTAQKRMNPFPISVEMLSRFRSKAKQEKILDEIRRGGVDLIIGTHRLLSNDIKFKDLGLLIIDEEQRFGVKHKEKLKELRNGIDVLSLSATPIPRTLHMSLVGIRDISVIEDPPDERHPVETFVVEKDEAIIREAVIKEISRGGQAYFVHNKIRDIERTAKKISNLVPCARVAYAHGQMNERKLEDIMVDFLNGEIDLLVCTTIIETGLDIPNVNTIFIDDSDHMGLSQLYQLRGRVGRSNRVARAYLMYEKNKIVSSVAEERLKAIREFTELGSGFKIAMRDLEIRGTGNLLGPQQHGQMESVGYDLYVKMMEEAVQRIKGGKSKAAVDTAIEIKIGAYISDEYVENEILKLEAYKRISSIENKRDYHEIQEEIEDRFGTPPQEVYNLLDVSYLKALAGKFGVSEIRENGDFYRMEMQKGKTLEPEMAAKILDKYRSNVHIHAGEIPSIMYRFKGVKMNPEKKLKEAILFMEKINSFKDRPIKL